MQSLQWSVLIGALVALFVATLWIWAKLWNNRKLLATQKKKQQTDLIASIKIIASAIVNGRLELVEGCIRLVPLLDQLSPHWRSITDLGVIGHIELIERLQKQPEQSGQLYNLCQDADLPHKLQASEVQRALNWLLQHNQTGYSRIMQSLEKHAEATAPGA